MGSRVNSVPAPPVGVKPAGLQLRLTRQHTADCLCSRNCPLTSIFALICLAVGSFIAESADTICLLQYWSNDETSVRSLLNDRFLCVVTTTTGDQLSLLSKCCKRKTTGMAAHRLLHRTACHTLLRNQPVGRAVLRVSAGSAGQHHTANRGPGRKRRTFLERPVVSIPVSMWHYGCPTGRPAARKGSCERVPGARHAHTRKGHNNEREGQGH